MSCDLKENLENAKSYFLEGVNTVGYCFKVIDGDTIKCVIKHNGEYLKVTVRLDGVDTPEKKSKPREAAAATDFIKKLALDKEVDLVFKSLDKYGRHLCDVFNTKHGGLSSQLIENNLGVKYHGGKKQS